MRTANLFFVAALLIPNMSSATSESQNTSRPTSPSRKIDTNAFYDEYHGHPISHLRTLAAKVPKPTIWLTGDSTLDNKYWIPSYLHSHSSHYHAAHLSHPLSKRDISYWLNYHYTRFTTLNCAVEATTLARRSTRLLPHDQLVADNIQSDDVLVVSIGGNDIALAPSFSTVMAVLGNVFIGGTLGMRHLTRLFRHDIERYIQRLIAKTNPKLVLVCMLYYPDETSTRSWAGFVLGVLGYNQWPARLQAAVRRVFDTAVSKVAIDGITVVPVPFFEVLDGKHSEHYVERVEPSEEGGQLMAKQIMEYIETALGNAKCNVPKS